MKSRPTASILTWYMQLGSDGDYITAHCRNHRNVRVLTSIQLPEPSSPSTVRKPVIKCLILDVRSLPKNNAIKQLQLDLTNHDTNIAIIIETWRKQMHVNDILCIVGKVFPFFAVHL
jgi:hypothetical protein